MIKPRLLHQCSRCVNMINYLYPQSSKTRFLNVRSRSFGRQSTSFKKKSTNFIVLRCFAVSFILPIFVFSFFLKNKLELISAANFHDPNKQKVYLPLNQKHLSNLFPLYDNFYIYPLHMFADNQLLLNLQNHPVRTHTRPKQVKLVHEK